MELSINKYFKDLSRIRRIFKEVFDNHKLQRYILKHRYKQNKKQSNYGFSSGNKFVKRRDFVKRGNIFKQPLVLSLAITLFLMIFSALAFSQEIDPFYIKTFQTAKNLFLEKDFKEAIKQFEIAAFGMGNNKELKATVHVFLCISYHFLRNTEQSEIHLKEASSLLSVDEIRNLDIPQNEKPLLENLLIRFGIVKELDAQIKELSNMIRSQPGNISLYYKLYGLYAQKGERKAAKNTLQNLLKIDPDEIDAYYLLGILFYQEDDFSAAKAHFENVLIPREQIAIGESMEEKAKVYLILSTHHSGNKDEALKLVGESINIFTPEKIESFSINDKDKTTLTSIIARYWREKRY